jgi:Lrp/AsnC family leucine-responsive transcriptional regulator
VLAFVFVRSTDFDGEAKTAELLSQIPEVQEAHHIAGEDCFLLKVRVKDSKTLGRLLRERIGSTGTVESTRTTIVLETLRESARIPLEATPDSNRELVEEVHHD